MQHPEPTLPSKSQTVADKYQPQSQSRPTELGSNGVHRLLSRASIRQKIGFGYALAIAIAVFGSIGGHITGDLYTKQAWEKLDRKQEEERLLSNLTIDVLKAQSYQQQLIVFTSNPKLFKENQTDFLEQLDKIQAILSRLKSLVTDKANDSDPESKALDKLILTYSRTLEAYSEQLEGFLKRINKISSEPREIIAMQKSLLDFTRSNVALDFERFSSELTKLVEVANQRQDKAELAVKQAKSLRIEITTASLVLSAAIATVLALYTSRAISRPLEAVTKVARRATEESNFDLQAPVTTGDEVGILATSLNSLIQSVAVYTKELEQARQTLEKRVEERTEELSQKNQQLQEAHDQLNQTLQNLQQTQAQLIQAEKMSSLGEMVAGIAHEINNPVGFIYGNLNHVDTYTQELLELLHLYEEEYPNPTAAIQDKAEEIDLDFLGEDLPKMISSMKTGADRIRQIVLSLRNFSRLDEAEIKAADIHEGIDSTLLILNHRIQRGIEVIKKYDNLPKLECFPAQLNQVFMNIIANAIDALEESRVRNPLGRGNLLPSGVNNQQSTPQIMIHTSMVDSNNISVRIWDNGSGIPPELQGKLFDPFFTTKPVGQGTGLGLAICYQIIEKHRGKIEVMSEPGQGTEVAVTLPITDILH